MTSIRPEEEAFARQRCHHSALAWTLGCVLLVAGVGIVRAAEPSEPGAIEVEATEPPTDEKRIEESTPTLEPPADKQDRKEEKPSYYRTKAASASRHPQPPSYVRTLDKHASNFGLKGFDDYRWLEFGIEQRTRFELRDDFYQENLESDSRFMMRTRGYLGIKEILDPLRFGFEFQDSRKLGSELDDNTGDVNQADILQMFAELYFKDAFGANEPLRFQFGRMSFDMVDRRLMARNRFRNTTNAFDGFRIRVGEEDSPWEVEFLAAQPVERFLTSRDHGDDETWFYGLAGYWRGWSPHLILEPYYFVLDRDAKGLTNPDQEFHTLGLHGFGLFSDSGFDYDFNFAFQFGNDGDLSKRGFFTHAELGYAFDHKWQPRIGFWVNYASGDRSPNDGVNERFDRLFGASHTFYGFSDIFDLRNLINPAIGFSLRPTKAMRLEAFYRAYWLADDSDAWPRAGRRDALGNSGDFIGQELDVRVTYRITRQWLIDIGYAHFFPGPFTDNTGPPTDDSDFFYVQTVWQF